MPLHDFQRGPMTEIIVHKEELVEQFGKLLADMGEPENLMPLLADSEPEVRYVEDTPLNRHQRRKEKALARRGRSR